MHARYDAKASGFSAGAVGLMSLSVNRRLDAAGQTEEAFAAAFADRLEQSADTWVREERDALLARLRAGAGSSPAAQGARPGRRPPSGSSAAPDPGSAAPAAADAEALAALTIADRDTYRRAVAEKQAGRLREALEVGRPLFTAYPDVVAVQELRCQLAMAAGGGFDMMRTECARYMDLSGNATMKKR
jgi:hypothetical protein